MCGIAGVISFRRDKETLIGLKTMTDSIVHRGPDGEGQWVDETGCVGLGHRRLSILDLSEAGKQPMHYADRYVITFNGEIYNFVEIRKDLERRGYRFVSHSDTEVLLALYDFKKEACLKELDGMFAFAIWDKQAQTLFCARDRFGEKPFYYQHTPGEGFYFASEMKALWAGGVPKAVNEVMLYNYLNTGFAYNPHNLADTFYKGIQKLKAAHYLVVDKNLQVTETQYWALKERPWSGSLNEACEQFNALFQSSVSRRLRSDVPVGSSLSGGLDSSLVVCTIDRIRKQENSQQAQKTFSARFPGFAKDEGQFMQLVIDKCAVEAHFTYPNDEDLLRNFDALLHHQEEPFGSASIFIQYAVMQLAKENGVTVMLDGQGADELLAGYLFYFRKHLRQLKRTASFQKELQSYKELHHPSKQSLRRLWLDLNATPLLHSIGRLKQRFQVPDFLSRSFADYRSAAFHPPSDGHSLNESLIYSATRGPLEELLRYADRNSMAHSREVRLPFLFHELAEFVISLPADYKISNGWTKYILRKASEGLLPEEITWRKDKIGYEPPQQRWMQNEAVKERIVEARRRLVTNGILDKKVLDQSVKAVPALGGQNESSWKHWMAANLYTG